MKTNRWAKEQELFCDFIEAYDESILEGKQQKFLKRADIILAAFIVFAICMVSVRL